jgi:GntR family transcriptional regulator/MocR family aminotransferase
VIFCAGQNKINKFKDKVMRIPLDRRSETPIYQQIEEYIRQSILSGSMEAGTRLPASRQLARDLGVNRITIETAYGGLVADGLIFSRVGSGTYVLPVSPSSDVQTHRSGTAWPLWQEEVLETNGTNGRPVEPDALLAAGGHPSPISFAPGVGDAHLIPAEDLRKVIQTVLRRDGKTALEYGERNGYGPLRTTIAHVLASQGIQVAADNILITAGSQQALGLVAQVLLKPGDVILVENPTYSGALDLFRTLRLKPVSIPTDERGMQVNQLESLLQLYHPKLIYTIPNFHNPTGTCLSGSRRRQLIALADRYNVPILEDDFVGDLRYDGRSQPALKSLDPGGRVIYVSTFSKMLMPGLRVGFLAAEGPVYQCLVDFKRVNDLATSSLVQRALEAYVTVGRYQAHLRRSVQVYKKRRDAMLQAIYRHLPGSVEVVPPQGGLFMWVKLPEGVSSEELLPAACKAGIAYTPGTRFCLDTCDGERYIRLNFVIHTPEEIDEGMMRLGNVLRAETS